MEPNNIISVELLAEYEAHAHGIRRTWSPEQYSDYATKLNRLVEAASNAEETLLAYIEEDPDPCEVAFAQHAALVTALRAIELPEEVENA